ncbi:MAG: hypothetical protein E5299_00278 [Burkholderia gladioli]|nr:MAG: hypothetical protein E5299_00278 [Burkholderia gladioli]
MRRMLRQTTRKINLVVDGHPVHWSATVKWCIAENTKRLRLILLLCLPGYRLELDPDELLTQDVKTNALDKIRTSSKAATIGMVRLQKKPKLIRNLFKKKHVSYAASY